MEKVIRRVLTSNGFQEIEVELPSLSEALSAEVDTTIQIGAVVTPTGEEEVLPTVIDKDILTMSGAELKDMCKALGISASGSNSAKINRILEATKSGEDSL